VGQLTQVTLPTGASLTYTYDAAHRLTDITDQLGNRIHHTLDPMGNRTKEETFDPVNNLTQTRGRVYDALNRLARAEAAPIRPSGMPEIASKRVCILILASKRVLLMLA
jgi:YD repeat-containing protein